MTSGMKVDDAIVQMYQDMKLSKKVRFFSMVLDFQEKKIKIDQIVKKDPSRTQDEEYKLFMNNLNHPINDKPLEGRYYVLDLSVQSHETGAFKDCLFFITWCPDGSSPLSNMKYTSSKNALVTSLESGFCNVQANSIEDLSLESLTAKLRHTR